MPRNYGYIDPLLSNLAVDYSLKVREGLVGPIIFPRILVGKPSGKYPFFSAEDAYKVPDVTMAGERSQANEVYASGTMKNYATTPRGLKKFIDKADLEMMEGPFRKKALEATQFIVSKLELAQEKRIANAINSLSGRSTQIATKWGDGKGDPYTDIRDGIAELFYRPNIMIMQESVFDAIEYHPKLLDKLGEANMIKRVDETTLGKLFRIDRVVIAKGRADFGKRKADKSLKLTGIWGDNVILGYTSEEWDSPCSGRTVAVKYAEADANGYVTRRWDEEDGGMLGGEYVQVAHDVDEMVIAPELIYSLKDVI